MMVSSIANNVTLSSLLSSMPTCVQAGQRKFLQQSFASADVNHLGYLDRGDLKIAMVAALGYKPSKFEVARVLSTCDDLLDVDGERIQEAVCLRHFVDAMEARYRLRDGAETIRQVFLAFDRRCQGFLSMADLKHAASLVAPHVPETSLEAIFRELDRDGDGRVSYGDFDFMMRYTPPT